MTADQELDRVVAWLRREMIRLAALAAAAPDDPTIKTYLGAKQLAVKDIADTLSRHEHRETNDG